jgi:hypothetical protein
MNFWLRADRGHEAIVATDDAGRDDNGASFLCQRPGGQLTVLFC